MDEAYSVVCELFRLIYALRSLKVCLHFWDVNGFPDDTEGADAEHLPKLERLPYI